MRVSNIQKKEQQLLAVVATVQTQNQLQAAFHFQLRLAVFCVHECVCYCKIHTMFDVIKGKPFPCERVSERFWILCSDTTVDSITFA